jgi:division protein CdvB (Snf7/Vps24/ESCRT-III family)
VYLSIIFSLIPHLLQVRPLQRTVASLQKQLQQQASVHAREVVALSERVMTVMNELRELRRQAESIQLLRGSIEQLQTELSHIQRGQNSEPSHDSTVSMSTLPDGPSNTTNAG